MKRHLIKLAIIFFTLALLPLKAKAIFEGEIPDFENEPQSAFQTVFERKPLTNPSRNIILNEDGEEIQRSGTKLPMDYVRAYIKKNNLNDLDMGKKFKIKKSAQIIEDAGVSVSTEEDKPISGLPSEENQMTMDCDYMEYFSDRNELEANGSVIINFHKDGTILKADKVIYNNADNLIKAFDNVTIIKSGNIMNGDYFQMNLNEETGIMDKPIGNNFCMEINSKKGYMYGDTIIKEQGYMQITQSKRIKFKSQMMGTEVSQMLVNDYSTLSKDVHEGAFKIKTKYLKINAKKNHDTITLKNAVLYHNEDKIINIPTMTFYTNKNQDYIEGNYMEVGSMGYFGSFLGPGRVFEIPNGSTLKVMPIINYQGGMGLGLMGKYKSATNATTLGYGSASQLFTVYGKQKLDDNLFINYAMNNFIRDGFMGRRWVKYGAEIVHEKEIIKPDFLLKGLQTSFMNRWSAGYMQDMQVDIDYNAYSKNLFFDKDENPLPSYNVGTMRLKYMGQIAQPLFDYKNQEKLTAVSLSLVAQGSTALYGTGDTQIVGRFGPSIKTQYKRWMQTVTYFQSAYSDGSPMPIFDKYYYGHSTVYLRETFRLHKLLSLSWLSAYNLSDDSWNKRRLQENTFMFSIGPDDIRLNLAYDALRASTYIGLDVDMDAKDTKIEYEKFEIKNGDKFAKSKKNKSQTDNMQEENMSSFTATNKKGTAPILQRAVITDIKDVTLKMENES